VRPHLLVSYNHRRYRYLLAQLISPDPRPYKLSDSEGLYLFVHPNGRRYWRVNYRHLGKQKTLAFSIWPDDSLADAREKRDSARRLLAKGTDPSDQAKLDKIAASVAAANTFKAIADEWLSKIEQDGLSPVTHKKHTGFSASSIQRSAIGPLPKSARMNC